MLTKKNIDDLSQPAREFYERAKLKMSVSLLFISLFFFFLALCCEAGGKSLKNEFLKDHDTGRVPLLFLHASLHVVPIGLFSASVFLLRPDDKIYSDKSAGFGFACFMYISGCIVAFAAGIYVSPLAGSNLEAKILTNPQELDSTAVSYTPEDATTNPAFAKAEPLYSTYPDNQSSVPPV